MVADFQRMGRVGSKAYELELSDPATTQRSFKLAVGIESKIPVAFEAELMELYGWRKHIRCLGVGGLESYTASKQAKPSLVSIIQRWWWDDGERSCVLACV